MNLTNKRTAIVILPMLSALLTPVFNYEGGVGFLTGMVGLMVLVITAILCIKVK